MEFKISCNYYWRDQIFRMFHFHDYVRKHKRAIIWNTNIGTSSSQIFLFTTGNLRFELQHGKFKKRLNGVCSCTKNTWILVLNLNPKKKSDQTLVFQNPPNYLVSRCLDPLKAKPHEECLWVQTPTNPRYLED